MPAVDAAELVAAWVSAADGHEGLGPVLAALFPDPHGTPPDRWTVAAWDSAVLRLLATVTPRPRLDGVAVCPACTERLDVNLAVPPVGAAPPGGASEEGAPVVIAVPGGPSRPEVVVTARAPTIADLDGALEHARGEPEAALPLLVDRIVVAITDPAGRPVEDEARAAAVAGCELVAALDAALVDEHVVVPAALRCDACGHRWRAAIALDRFAFDAVERAAVRLLDEVHRLAAAYGWSHDDILALPAPVRRHYLGRVPA